MKKITLFTTKSSANLKAETVGKGILFLLVITLPFISSSQLLDQGLVARFIVLASVTLMISIYFLFFTFKNKTLRSINDPVILLSALLVVYLAFRISPAYVFGDALFDWLKQALFFTLLILVYQLLSFKTIRLSVSWSLAFLGLILSFWGFYELISLIAGDGFQMPFSTYEIKTAFEHRNLFAQVLLLTLPFQLLLSFNRKSKVASLIFLVSATASLFLLVVLSSRAIWLACLISLLVLALVFILKKKDINELVFGKQEFIRLSVVFAVGILSAVLFFQFQDSSEEIKSHSQEIFNPEKGTIKERYELWNRSLTLFKESPVFGKGLSNWKIEVLKYNHEGLVSEDNLTFYQRPHNDFLWILTETGLAGLLLFLILIGLVLFRLSRIMFKAENTDVMLFFSAVLMAISGFLIFSFFSFPRERIFHNLIFTLLITSVVAFHPAKEKNQNIKSKPLFTFLIGLIFLLVSAAAIVDGYYRFEGEKQLKKAMIAKNNRNYPKIISKINEAESLLYQMDPTSTPLSWYSGFAFFKQKKLPEAKEQFLNAYTLNPYHIHVLNNLASTYAIIGKNDSAIFYYKKAVKIAPNFDESWFNMSAVYFNLKEYDLAYESLKKVNLFTTDSRYKPFVKTIVRTLLVQELENLSDTAIYSLPENQDWYFEVHKMLRNKHKSLKNIIFEKQILSPKQ